MLQRHIIIFANNKYCVEYEKHEFVDIQTKFEFFTTDFNNTISMSSIFMIAV